MIVLNLATHKKASAGNNPPPPTGAQTTTQTSGAPAPALKSMTKEDWIRLGTAILTATAAFWFFHLLLYFAIAPSWAFWLIVSIAFASCLLVLSAVDAAVITKSGLGTSIVLFMFLQAGLLTVWHYSHVKKDKTEQADSKGRKSTDKIIVVGTEVFDLKAGEETPWLGTKDKVITDLTISSPDYNFRIFVSDGTDYPGGTTLPGKNHCYYKIKANSDQFVTVTAEPHVSETASTAQISAPY